jgi:hypothetical protein
MGANASAGLGIQTWEVDASTTSVSCTAIALFELVDVSKSEECLER